MKKNFLLVGLLVLGMVAFQSCKKDENLGGGTVDPGLGGEMEELAPSAQKTRLQDVGLEFIDAIKTETHENLVDVMAYMDEADFEEFEVDEDYIAKLEDLYAETEPDYYGVAARNANPVKAIQGLMNLSLDIAQSGVKLATRADDIYMFTLNAGLKDVYGGFKPDMDNGVWVYDKSITDRVEVEFTDDHNQKWVATLKGSKETTRVHLIAESKYYEEYVSSWGDNVYDDHEKYDIIVDVPEKITLVVACNKNTVVDMTVNSGLALETDVYENCKWYENYYTGEYSHDHEYKFSVDYKNLNLDASLNVNGYAENWKVEANKSGISTTAEVKIDGKSMLKAEAALNADIDAIIKQANDAANVEDEDEIKLDPKVIKEFTMYVDVMGKVQIVGKCDKFEDLYDAVMDVENAYDEDDFKKFERNINQINGTYSVTIHYDKTETVQANVELEAYEEVYEDWGDEWTDFEVRPILIFAADDSRYCFEDYFTESSFNDLVEAAQDLAEDFENMFERYF